jgi:translation initiation factor IF-2
MPNVGAEFKSFEKKRDAEEYAESFKSENACDRLSSENPNKKTIPIVLKADVLGSIEAIEKEVEKISSESAEFKIIQKGVGPISESDVKTVASCENAIVVGFNVKADRNATELAETRGITISFFNIIYKLTEWLQVEMEARRPKIETVEITGKAKILKAFSKTKEKQVLGGKVIEGKVSLNGIVKIIRRENEIGKGKIVNLEKNKSKTSEVEEGSEFGMMLESKIEIVPGDVIESFAITQK